MRTAFTGLALIAFMVGSPVHAQSRRFAYVTVNKLTGEETLWTAALRTGGTIAHPPAATAPKLLQKLPGAMGAGGEAPEAYQSIVVARGNARFAAYSEQVTPSFRDANVRVFDMATGSLLFFVNEHRFSAVSRALCSSTRFSAFLAEQAASGVPAGDLAALDFHVDPEDPNFTGPVIMWTSTGRLRVTYGFRVLTTWGDIGDENFTLEFDPATGPAILACNPPPEPATLAANIWKLSIGSSPGLWPGRILIEQSPLRLYRKGFRWAVTVPAKLVGGQILRAPFIVRP